MLCKNFNKTVNEYWEEYNDETRCDIKVAIFMRMYNYILKCIKTHYEQPKFSLNINFLNKLLNNLHSVFHDIPEKCTKVAKMNIREWFLRTRYQLEYIVAELEIKAYSKTGEYDLDTCPICGDDFDNGRIVYLSCGHKFHLKCISKWSKNHNTCPVCRKVYM